MIKPYKGRELEEGQLVQVYRNLHNKMFSIRCQKTRLVLAHGTNFIIEDAKTVVNQNARKKVNKERLRTVHAYLEGKFCGEVSNFFSEGDIGDEVYYNPYETEEFILKRLDKPFDGGDVVVYGSKAYSIKKRE